MSETPVKRVKGSFYKPPSERPEDTNLGLSDYIEDAKVRWQIHLYEWDEFTQDVIIPTSKTVYAWTLTTVEKIKESYYNINAENNNTNSQTSEPKE